MRSLQQYWNLLSTYLKPQGRTVALMALVVLGSIGLQLFTPRVLRDFIDLSLSGGDFHSLTRKAIVFLALVLLTQLASTLSTYLSEQVAWTATNALRVDLVAHCLRLDMAFHHQNPPGALIERVDGDVDALSNFFSQFVVRVTANLLLILGVLILLFREDWRAGAGMTFFVAVAIWSMLRIRKVGVPRWAALRQKNAEAFGFLGETLHGLEDIRSSGAMGYIRWRFDEILRLWLPLRRKAMLAFSFIWTSSLLLFTLGTGIAFGLGYSLWSLGAISVGTVYLLYNYTELIRQPVEQIRNQMQDLQRAGASIGRIQDLLVLRSRVQSGDRLIPEGPLAVEFRNVTFSYASDETALKEINFHLSACSVLGLLGRTGSGKSTLARLLVRLYDPEAGQIMLGDVPLRHGSLKDISCRVGLVPQEVQVFQATVRDNFTLFDPAIDDGRVLRIIEEFELLPWFRALPSGLDTELAGSAGLSGGQVQLLNFARIALRDPGLVILDEATSRLDPVTQALVGRATKRLLEGRTAIIIAHRLDTVQSADFIMILENGTIAEFSGREQLMRDPGSKFSALLRAGMEEVLQ